MKNITHTLLTLLSISLLLLLLCTEGCKKDTPAPVSELDKLPPATQTGENTFGCLINGKAAITKTSAHAFAAYQLGFLQIGADLNKKGLTLLIVGMPTTNTKYDLLVLKEASVSFSSYGGLPICEYEQDDTLNGSITLTRFDKVVSGTFLFETYTSTCDTVKVTNGRFDLPLIF